MNEKIIEKDGKKLAIFVKGDKWRKGLHFVSSDKDYLQVGIWGYEKGKSLEAHIHNEVKREILRTQEMIFIRKGRLKALIYSDKAELVDKISLGEGDVLILLNGGHGYEILEDDTQVLEVKNGPYVGADKDRRRIEV